MIWRPHPRQCPGTPKGESSEKPGLGTGVGRNETQGPQPLSPLIWSSHQKPNWISRKPTPGTKPADSDWERSSWVQPMGVLKPSAADPIRSHSFMTGIAARWCVDFHMLFSTSMRRTRLRSTPCSILLAIHLNGVNAFPDTGPVSSILRQIVGWSLYIQMAERLGVRRSGLISGQRG